MFSQSTRTYWKYQTYDNALMTKIQQSSTSVKVSLWHAVSLAALVGCPIIDLNRTSRIYWFLASRTSLTFFFFVWPYDLIEHFEFHLQSNCNCCTRGKSRSFTWKSINANKKRSRTRRRLNWFECVWPRLSDLYCFYTGRIAIFLFCNKKKLSVTDDAWDTWMMAYVPCQKRTRFQHSNYHRI